MCAITGSGRVGASGLSSAPPPDPTAICPAGLLEGAHRVVLQRPLRRRSQVPRVSGAELGDEQIDPVGVASWAYSAVAAERGQSVQRAPEHLGEHVDVLSAGDRAHGRA